MTSENFFYFLILLAALKGKIMLSTYYCGKQDYLEDLSLFFKILLFSKVYQ